MKKFILTAAIAAFGLSTAVAQDAGLQGTWFVGGQVAFGSDKTSADAQKENSEFKSTTILPIVGTFITPSVAIGAGVGYMGSETKVLGGSKTAKGSTIVIKPLARKYWNITGGLFFFGQAAVPILFGDTKNYNAITGAQENKVKTNSVALELSPGFDYVINSWMTIETSFRILSVGFDSVKPKGGSSESSFNFNANPFNSVNDRNMGSLQVGVKFLF